jgi:uncharacterized repeat protein (TIGR03803 family)
MKIRISRLCTFTLIALCSLFGFAAQAGAQDNFSKQLNGPPKLRGKKGNTHKARIADSSGYSVLYSFCPGGSPCTDGDSPNGLVQDAAGNLYGTTHSGGANNGGTVFKVDSTGHETVLYSFCSVGGSKCTDGGYPVAGLILDAAGNLYGTTSSGGANFGGTVFKVDNTDHETVLYSFCSVGGSNCTDGAQPYAGLIRDASGNLYGTTTSGGAFGGTVFKLDNTNHETVLYSFCSVGGSNCTDGAQPYAGLIRDTAGNLYGTTNSGGANNFHGTVFKVDNTDHETVLYSFCPGGSPCTDGADPYAGVIRDTAGNLYGTTTGGGNPGNCGYSPNCGTVFKVDSAGHETVLYSFCSVIVNGNCADGAGAFASLIQDAAGNLYGTTRYGGGNSNSTCLGGSSGFCGTVFMVDGTGHETVLYNFCSESNCADGDSPGAALIQDAGGNLYGTTLGGGNSNSACGSNGCGTVFKLAIGGGGTAAVTLSTTKLSFPKTVIGVTSKPKSVTLTNTGTATLHISGITASGDFAISNNTCGATVLVGASCKVSVTFTPTAKGKRTGNLTFTDDAPTSPQVVALVGTGTAIQLTPTSLNFGTVTVGNTSSPKTITITNVSAATVTSSITVGGTNPADFLINSNTCGATLPGGASCVVGLVFKPQATGTRTAMLKVADDGGGSPQTAALKGIGG